VIELTLPSRRIEKTRGSGARSVRARIDYVKKLRTPCHAAHTFGGESMRKHALTGFSNNIMVVVVGARWGTVTQHMV
jgi:hypothetical protein